jgi:hypothetical protein
MYQNSLLFLLWEIREWSKKALSALGLNCGFLDQTQISMI